MLKPRKYVVVQEEKPTYCFLVFNHYGHSLEVVNALAASARQDFPHLLDSQMSFRTYKGTGNMDGMLGCEFAVPEGFKVPPSYRETSRLPSY